jgi:hypothetical protein
MHPKAYVKLPSQCIFAITTLTPVGVSDRMILVKRRPVGHRDTLGFEGKSKPDFDFVNESFFHELCVDYDCTQIIGGCEDNVSDF